VENDAIGLLPGDEYCSVVPLLVAELHFWEVDVVASYEVPESSVKVLNVVNPLQLPLLFVDLVHYFLVEGFAVTVFDMVYVLLCQNY